MRSIRHDLICFSVPDNCSSYSTSGFAQPKMMMMLMKMMYSAFVSARQMRKVVVAALKRLHSFTLEMVMLRF